MENKPQPETYLGKAFRKARDFVAEEAEEIKKDVVRDAGELKHELVKYGKNRLVSGGAAAFKGGVLGTFAGPLGMKVGAVAGFVAGFFGGPIIARRLDRVFNSVGLGDSEKAETKPSEPETPQKDDRQTELPLDGASPSAKAPHPGSSPT